MKLRIARKRLSLARNMVAAPIDRALDRGLRYGYSRLESILSKQGILLIDQALVRFFASLEKLMGFRTRWIRRLNGLVQPPISLRTDHNRAMPAAQNEALASHHRRECASIASRWRMSFRI